MSGTSLDGVDAALLATDGERAVRHGLAVTIAYDADLRGRLRQVLGGRGDVLAVGRAITLVHAEAVEALLGRAGVAPGAIRAIGFHGQTILHRPEDGITWQIGDPALLAERTRIDIVANFRRADMAAGGQGAPLAPLYHAALALDLERPAAVLNLGGVANVTWLGADGRILAFDTGPGGALLDDWVLRLTGAPYDADGALARAGTIDEARIAAVLAEPFFDRPPPKSLDRDAFGSPAAGLDLADGAATLTRLTARAVAIGRRHLPELPGRWLVTGGGRRNPSLMAALAGELGVAVEPVESAGWDGDALEAEAFAYLAARSLRGLPLSLPSTTGCRRPTPGGALYRAPASSPAS
ncbi:MAG: anhydro-N-acetylmuramic acid kinase [Alphaproteobacteria bacterium]